MTGLPVIEAYSMPVSSQLPSNIPNWQVDPKRAVLLIHDMQQYFIRPIPERPGTNLINNISRLRHHCKKFSIPVAYTRQPGEMTEKQRGLLKDFWGPGMKAESQDRSVVDELSPDSNDWSFTKWRYSAFFRSDLLKKMHDSKRNQLIICGVYGHIGILTTAIEAFSNDIETFLVADAIGDFSLRHHLMGLNYAAQCCAVVSLAGDVLQCLEQ